MSKLHIDIETYSSVNLQKSGVYKYCESKDFNIILFAYAFDNEPIIAIDTFHKWKLPQRVVKALEDPSVTKCAHNANFERICIKAMGFDIPIEQWECSAIKAGYCGLPMSLANVSEALELGEKGKKSTGKALIRYFCLPCKPTKANGGRTRNLPKEAPEKWDEFKEYCRFDVEAEREVMHRLAFITIPEFEQEGYVLDQEINDRGVKVDTALVQQAIAADEQNAKKNLSRMVELTGLANPNSQQQITGWLSDRFGFSVTSITKDKVTELLTLNPPSEVVEVLNLRKKTSKTSIKKYEAMMAGVNEDDRARGLFQHYGAFRTGRWAGRRIQLQNLARNNLNSLDAARQTLLNCGIEGLSLLYSEISSVLSQLTRTSFIPEEGSVFAVADFSAIEARVLSWLANEQWRLDVFKTHGKIYEASASRMFGIPLESIGKDSPYRFKGKVAELALGYQGGVGALKKMGGEAMGLTGPEMVHIVASWRKANLNIVDFWYNLDRIALSVIKRSDTATPVGFAGMTFYKKGGCLIIKLPSGRELVYQKASIGEGKFGNEVITYMGSEQVTGKWKRIDGWGGKLTENIVQAISRDLLLFSIAQLAKAQIPVVIHVHDEVVCEVPELESDKKLLDICKLMAVNPPWAEGLPLAAEGFTSLFYKK